MPDRVIHGSQGADAWRGPALSSFPLVRDSLYAQSDAPRWSHSLHSFAATLERSAAKSFAGGIVESAKLEEFLASLHLRDLALASACIEGCDAAWEHFVTSYRGYMRSAAAAILRCSRDSPEARDLADSLFADLYGITNGKPSLFRYFHGRSSLKTWLRAVLAQRHVDGIRASKRLVDLDDGDDAQVAQKTPQLVTSVDPADPHRERYLALFRQALETALAGLDSRDKLRLRCYYVDQETLAAAGRTLGEHESSVSRNLERIRRVLREQVEGLLRMGPSLAHGVAAQPGLSDAEIALCFEYAAEEAPINFDTLFPATARDASSAGPESANRAERPSGKEP